MLPHYNWSKNFAWNPRLSRWGEYSFEQILVCMGTSYKRFLISPFVLDPILMANDSIKKGTQRWRGWKWRTYGTSMKEDISRKAEDNGCIEFKIHYDLIELYII